MTAASPARGVLSASGTRYSFDVFDTVITRAVGSPPDVFHLVQAELAAAGAAWPGRLRAGFARARILAERRARRASLREDVTLDEIHAALAREFGLDAGRAAELRELELRMERRVTLPVRATIDAIHRLRAECGSIIFLSDMYLPSAFIRQLLVDCGALREGDLLYVSGEVGLCKASGNLYRHVLEEIGCAPGQLVHYGDNEKADRRVPASLGIRFNDGIRHRLAPARHERAMRGRPGRFEPLHSSLRGIARACRLERCFPDEHRQVIWDTASTVAGPLFFLYVWWVLRTARERGIERLYFMARDAHILLKIARIIAAACGWETDLRYLYASRQSLLVPAALRIPSCDPTWLLLYLSTPSIRAACRTLNTEPEEVAADLARYGFDRATWDRELEPEDHAKFRACFDDASVRAVLVRNCDASYAQALGYVAQEGLLDGIPFGLVDLGWHGHTQMALSGMLDEAGRRPPRGVAGFYFGFGRKLCVYRDDAVLSFCVANRIRRVLLHPSILEVLAAADHGRTVGYAQRDGRHVPVLEREHADEAIAWGVRLQHEAILNFCSAAAARITTLPWSPGAVRDVTRALLGSFVFRPDAREGEVYGSYPFSCFLAEDSQSVLAPGLDRSRFWQSHFRRERVVSLWFPGTFARSGGLLPESLLWRLNLWRREVQATALRMFDGQRRYYRPARS